MLACSTALDHVKQEIHSKSGIPPQEQRWVFQQKPITCSSALHKVHHGGNIFMNLKVRGGAGECDICYLPGEYICDECNNQVTCCGRIHRHPNRVSHNPLLLTDTSSKPSHSLSSLSSNESDPFSDDDFSCLPSLNISFEHAARIATLAESFSLTCFSDFQTKSTLLGKDSIVVQPTGSGKSLCLQFPPVYQEKKGIVVTPTISLMRSGNKCR